MPTSTAPFDRSVAQQIAINRSRTPTQRFEALCELLDLEAEKLLMRRTVTFRGDNDAAYRHAANFVSDTLKESMPKP